MSTIATMVVSWLGSVLTDCRTPKLPVTHGNNPTNSFLTIKTSEYYSPNNPISGINCHEIIITPPLPRLIVVGLFNTTRRSKCAPLHRVAPLLPLVTSCSDNGESSLMFALPKHNLPNIQSGRSAVFQWLKLIGQAPKNENELPIFLGYNFSLEVRSYTLDDGAHPLSIDDVTAAKLIRHYPTVIHSPHIFIKSHLDAALSSPQFTLSSKMITKDVMSAFVGWHCTTN